MGASGTKPIACFSTDLEALHRLYGHLRAYVILGMRMGQVARERYPLRIYATLYSGSRRPRSCIADGVQFSSCCTLGKANIRIQEGREARARFTDCRTGIEITVKSEVLERIDREARAENEESVSLEAYKARAEDLLSITSIEPWMAW